MVGIMCGYANTSVSVTNCFAYGDCAATGIGSKFVGAFAGGDNNYPISNSYFCSAKSDKNATRLSVDQLKDIASFREWDFESIWDMGADHPILRGFSEGGGIVVPPVEEEHVHIFVETSRTAPTCTTYGQIGYTCSCGEIRNELIEPTQHDYYIGYTCDPTCTEDGYIEFTCLNEGCRASKRQTIEALGHSYGYDSVCDRCGHRIESHAHNYVTTVVEPTCSSTGHTEYYCSCGHSYKGNFVEPTRHAWNGGEESMPANCTTDGIVIYTCEDCGATKTTIIKAEHTWSETVTVEKTCTTDGSVTKTCTVCGIVNVEIIPAGHVWNEGVETLAPTCETAGSKTCVCTVCSV